MPNKAQFVELLAERLDGDRKRAAAALDAVIDTVYAAVARGEKVAISGFGVFERRERAARTARNPATGASVRVAASRVPAFRPGAEFKAIASGAREFTAQRSAQAQAAVSKAAARVRDAADAVREAPGKAAAAVTSGGKKPAKAGKRSEWRGRDKQRPLEPAGAAQAARLAVLLAMFAPDRVVSAEPVRCVETVRPLADSLGLPVGVDPAFGDEAFAASPHETEHAVLALAKHGTVSVVCSQGETIPGLVDRLGRGVRESVTKKAAFWALSVVDGGVVATDYYDDALR